MRESVPAPLRFRFPNLFRAPISRSVLTLSSLCLALGGCSGETKGQIVLALQTDMSMPEDITRVKIEVKAEGVSRYDRTFVVDPDDEAAEKIPATLAIVAGEKENETVELKVIALRPGRGSNGLEPRTLNKTITTIPKERVAMLRVPMQWLCTGEVSEIDDEEYESTCEPDDGKERSCVAGGCQDVRIDSSKLPDFAEDEVFGGSAEASEGTCFPTEACFDAGETLIPDENCVVEYEPESDDILNFAILSVGGGICRDSLCYVALDKSQEFGWYELENGEGPPGAGGASNGGGQAGEGSDVPPLEARGARRFQLPQGVCDRMADGRARGVRVSTDEVCEITKTPRYPTCGPWSSVGGEVEPPPPPPADSDDDGHDSTDFGGDDCDDEDDTVYPGAEEICGDGVDQDCNDMIDDCASGPDADGDGVDGPSAGGTDCDDNDNSVYPGALEACDSVDNDCNELVDDNCVEELPFSHRVDLSVLDGFVSTADYAIYQQFDETRSIDLDQKTVTFLPNSAHTRYTVTTTDLDWDDDEGEMLPVRSDGDVSNCDDCFTSVSLEFPFDFYGNEYTTVFPSSNGYLTFGVGDSSYSESVQQFLANAPRISAYWDDLDTRGAEGTIDDEVLYFADETKVVVTYRNIQIYSNSGTTNTFQFVLLADGTIKISYDGLDDIARSALVGITPGSLGSDIECEAGQMACFGSCVDLDTSADHCGSCGNACNSELCVAGTCAPDAQCTVGAADCSGICAGTCELRTAAACDGQCFGTCSGTCDPPADGANCSGTCDGDCTGSCALGAGGVCPDLCSGVCYVDTIADCPDPTVSVAGGCVFNAATLTNATQCYETGYIAGNSPFGLTCVDSTCTCSKQSSGASVSFTIATTPADACESFDTLRATLLRDCLTADQCGGGCPTTVPGARAACDSTAIQSCAYYDGMVTTNCSCTNNTFICN